MGHTQWVELTVLCHLLYDVEEGLVVVRHVARVWHLLLLPQHMEPVQGGVELQLDEARHGSGLEEGSDEFSLGLALNVVQSQPALLHLQLNVKWFL